ncbi:unnamed protein product [Euphydryas editha]|uniref:Mos1 transposase HTH domain-containing protein n=1 Tax=Euphydryas editha TaxID=104508 RepID=A0AAU9UKK6_EUPED|nr:unnamed protein product [Euphydryas editha]
MDTLKIQMIFEYEFRRGTNASEIACNINVAFGKGNANKHTVPFWFKCFHDGNFVLKKEPRVRPAITVYCAEFRTMIAKLEVKQPRLINRSSPLLLHDNARPHTARETVLTLQELQLKTIRHPPYSPDLAPMDYHFFRALDNFLHDKSFLLSRQDKMLSHSLSHLDHQSSIAKA